MQTHGTLDSSLILKDAGLVATSAAATVASAAKVFDVGAADVRVQGDIIIDVTALEIATGDEAYTIVVQGSPVSAFTAAGVKDLCQMHLGAKGTKITDSDKDDTPGRYILPFRNDADDVVYRYLRLYTVVAGDIATGINYSAYIALKRSV